MEQKKLSPYKLAEKVQVDQKSIKAWAMKKRSNIQWESINILVSGLKDDIDKEFKGILEFTISELAKDGIDRKDIWKIFHQTKDILTIIEKIQELDISEKKYFQEELGTANIIRILKNLLSAYREYFQVNEKEIGEGENVSIYAPLIYNLKRSIDIEKSIPDINYLVLRFPTAYYVGIILTNYMIDYSDSEKLDYYCFMIEKLKTQNDLKMLLFITDIDKKTIPVSVQSSLMEKYNLFFEFVKEKDLQEISIQDLKLQKEDFFSLPRLVDQHRYAQFIFERFMSYLSVISNEIIFQPYLDKLHKELDSEKSEKIKEESLNKILVSYRKRSEIKNFTYYANEILIKEVCRYSYLSRHVIYYERNLIAEILEDNKIKKPSLVVEICAPNSLTTCNIIEKCERLLLFTTSHSAYSLMTKLEEKTDHHFLPSNVSLQINHLDPEYMTYQYPEDLNGKVDLLVIGYGAGSQISDLTRFMRYAYNWLSESGILFISVYNKEAIILNKYHIHDQRFESSPLYISDYWTYTMNEQSLLLKKLRAYSPENFQSTYLSLFETENIHISTYPYISALINPSEYSRTILDEIREADKSFAKSGIHGQLIDVIVPKNKLVKKTDTKVKNYLMELNIKYDCYAHTLAPDSKSLKRSLQEEKIFISDATLLKTVIIQEKNQKSSHKNCWNYVILPYDKKVAYDEAKYELVSETFVMKKYNQGTISPLAVLAERAVDNESTEGIFLSNDYCIDKTYVIMLGDSNSESIRIKTSDFLEIVEKAHITVMNTFE